VALVDSDSGEQDDQQVREGERRGQASEAVFRHAAPFGRYDDARGRVDAAELVELPGMDAIAQAFATWEAIALLKR
jgi:hypothetical protein